MCSSPTITPSIPASTCNQRRQIIAFATIPNELIIEIANHLPTRELSLLSSTSHALADLLTPYLLRHATNDDLFNSIILHRPASVRSILCSPTVNANNSITVPDSNLPAWPLHHAAQYSTPVIVAILIHHGVPVDEPERHHIPNHATALQCAVLSGSPANVTLFLDAGANIDRASDHTSSTPLDLACVNSFNDIANLLIDRGARISAHELISVVFVGNNTLLKRMLDMGAPVDSLYTSRWTEQPITPLQYLCRLSREGLCSTAVILLRKGADVNRGRKGDSSPLHCAARSGNARLARTLMDYGAEAESEGMEREYFRGIYHA